MDEQQNDPAYTKDVNKNCNDLFKLETNEKDENEKTTFQSVINVNLLNNNNSNSSVTLSSTLKSDFLNSTTLKSPNLVKNNNLKNIINDQPKSIQNDPSSNVTKTDETHPKSLKGILKTSKTSEDIAKSSKKISGETSVDEIHSRLAESQSKISELQNSLPTKLNSATIDAIKSNYSPIKNHLRQSTFKTKFEINEAQNETNNLNAEETDETNDSEELESLDDEYPEKLDGYARFIKEFTMSEDNKKKKRSNSFRKISKLFGLQKKSEPKTDEKASTSCIEQPSTGYFNRNARERHTFTNFSCKNYSKEHTKHENYPISAWTTSPNSYFKEDEYSLPIDACIPKGKKEERANSNLPKQATQTIAEDYVCMNLQASAKNDYENNYFCEKTDNSQDRHVLIEPNKAVIPLNTERALPNPYHKNNNVIPESMILEPMYINVNNKKQENYENWNDGTLEQNLNTQIEKQEKIFNLEYETKISNSPYETIFGHVRPQGRIVTRSLSPEQRLKMDVKLPIINSRKSLSPTQKSFNNECCLKSTPKHDELDDIEVKSPKSPISKIKSNKKSKKLNRNETIDEFSHQNLEIPIDYPEINLNNNTSKDSPKKQLYENYPDVKLNQNVDSFNLNNIPESVKTSEKLPEFVENSGCYPNSANRSHSTTSPNNLRNDTKRNEIINLESVNQSNSRNESRINAKPIYNLPSTLPNPNRFQDISQLDTPHGRDAQSHNTTVNQSNSRNESGIKTKFIENSEYCQNLPSNEPNPHRFQDISQLNTPHAIDASPNDSRNGSKVIQNINLQSYNQNSSRNESNRSEMLPNSGYYQNSPSNISELNRSHQQLSHSSPNNLRMKSNQNINLQPLSQKNSGNESNSCEITPKFNGNSASCQNSPSGQQMSHNSSLRDASPNNSRGSENSGYYQNSPSNLPNPNRFQDISQLNAIHDRDASPNDPRNGSKLIQNIDLQSYKQNSSRNESNRSEMLPKFIENPRYYQNSSSDIRSQHSQRISPLVGVQSTNSSPISLQNLHISEQQIGSTSKDLNKNNQRLSQPSPSRISPAIVSYSSNSSPVNYPRISSVSPQTVPINSSPQKLLNLQNVEAFYWKKISEMKEKEQMNHMYFQPQTQMTQFGNNISDARQSRSRNNTSHSVIPQNRGRRSLSLPRNIRPEKPNNMHASFEEPTRLYSNNPEGNTSGYGYTTVQQGPSINQLSNFNRRTPQRSTISAIKYNNTPGDAIYENYVPGVQFRHQALSVNKPCEQTYAPIFKRGSLQKNSQEDMNIGNAGQKKVSFLSATQSSVQPNQQSSPPAWPTKNGYVQSPPTRRNNRSESVGSDNVFISETPTKVPSTCDRTQLFFPNNQDYGRTHQQIMLAPMYGQDIYGQAIYGKTIQVPQNIYGNAANQNAIYGKTSSAVYGKTAQPKQVIVRNKVCDMYGQIHDTTDDSNQIYGQIKKSGIIYGELKGPSNCQTMNPLQQRALPSPPQKQSQSMIVPRSSTYVYSNAQMNQLPQQIQSESESGSEAGEVQRIMNNMDVKNQPIPEEEWNADGKSGRGHSGNESGGVVSDGELRGSRSGRSARRDDPRRHTLSGDQHLYQPGGTPGGILRTMDLESSLPRGYPPPNAMLFDDDPGIMSEVETSSTGFRRGGKQRSSLPVVRTPSKTLERPLGLVFLQYRNETKRALLPNEITSIDTVKALFVRSFPKQLTMEYLDSPLVKIYIHDSSKDMFYELEDLRSHLRDIRDRSVLRLFESTDISGGLPVAGQGISGGVGHFEDQSYFSEPEFDSEYQHQHIHKSKSSAKAAPPYYLASTTSTLPRGGPLLRTYSPAIGGAPPIPADRIKSLPGQTDRMRTDGYMSSPERSTRGQYEDPYYSQFAPRSGSITPVIDEEASDTELLDESYSLYGAKIPSGGPRAVPAPRSQFPTPAAVPYDTTRIRVEHMERQLANLTGLVQKALTQAPTAPRDFLIPPGRDSFRSGDEFDKNSSSSSTSLPDDSYLRSDTKTPKLGKSGCHKSVSFEKSVSFSDEPPDMNSPKQHSPQHTADTKPPKPAIKSSTLPRTSSQERDRLKPAPPPKPAALAVQYDSSRHLYRDLQLTPEMYNQLRGLQKKAKDLRAEVRNLRRMSQAQAHSVRETIRDTFIKIRTMLLVGGEQAWQAGMDQERVRLSREEDLYKQEMIRLEKDLSDLESTVEELRGNVINRKTRVNMSDVENMALILSKSSKTVADLKVRFPSLQEGLKGMLTSEMEKVVREEKFLKEEPERLESALRRCKKLTGTLVTLKRLASVQEQRLPCPGNPTGDGRLSPSTDETPPVTPTSAQHGKPNSNLPTSRPNVGPGGIGGDSIDSESSQRPENALDALLDELQTFSRPHNSAPPPSHALPQQQSTTHAPSMGEIGRKGSMDSHALTVSTGSGTGSLRRLHSYPSGSDTDNSPPIQPAPRAANIGVKPPLPERNAELLQALAGRRVPPPPPPRTSSRSPLASPTSPGIPPRNNTPSTLQHIQNVQNMAQNENTTQSQFDAARENLGLGGTLRRNVPGRSSLKERSQTLPRNIGSNLQVHTQQQQTEIDNNMMMLTASNSSSCESVNSQEGAKKSNRQEQLEMRHQELLKKQKALQEQYARLQQLQRGNNALTVVPPTPDILLKKTGSESNILQKMGLNMMTASPQINTGSLTHLANNNGNLSTVPVSNENSTQQSTGASTTSKVYETDIL